MADAGKNNRRQELLLHVFFDQKGEEVGRAYEPAVWSADCPDCGGNGQTVLLTSTRKCNTCQGTGKIDAAPPPTPPEIQKPLPSEAKSREPSEANGAKDEFQNPMWRSHYVYGAENRLVMAVSYNTHKSFRWEDGQWFTA